MSKGNDSLFSVHAAVGPPKPAKHELNMLGVCGTRGRAIGGVGGATDQCLADRGCCDASLKTVTNH